MGRGFQVVCRGFQVVGRGSWVVGIYKRSSGTMYLKKAGLASLNIVHLQEIILSCVGFCFYFLLSPSRLTTTEGRERNAGYEADLARHVLVLLSVSCVSFRRKHGRRYMEKEKKVLLALRLVLCVRRLVFTTCAVLPALMFVLV